MAERRPQPQIALQEAEEGRALGVVQSEEYTKLYNAMREYARSPPRDRANETRNSFTT
jgi:hypothetical protein